MFSIAFEALEVEVPGLPPEHCKYNDIIVFPIAFEALEVPGIPPTHCKYNDVTLFSIAFEALEVPGIPPEHCKYSDIIMFSIAFEALEVPGILQHIANITISRCLSSHLIRSRYQEYLQQQLNR